MKLETASDRNVSIDRFVALVGAYGASPERWPDSERRNARMLLDGLADAAEYVGDGGPACDTNSDAVVAMRMREEASNLDRWLDHVRAIEPSSALRNRILDAVPYPRFGADNGLRSVTVPGSWLDRLLGIARELWPFGPAWHLAGAFAVSGTVGVVLGLSGIAPQRELSSDEGTVVSEVLLVAGEMEDYWSDR